MTKKQAEERKKVVEVIKQFYLDEGTHGVKTRLSRVGIERKDQTIRLIASELGILRRKKRNVLETPETKVSDIPPQQQQSTLNEVIAEIKKMPENDPSASHLGESFIFPTIVEDTTLENPFVVETPQEVMPFIRAINTPMIGVCADAHPYHNPFSNALRLAEYNRKYADKTGFPVVFITGNFIHVDTLKYSKLRAHRSLVAQTKPITLSELTMEEDREVQFVSIEKRIKARVEMLKQASVDEDGKPLYGGPIYFTFGKREEDIITFWVDEHSRKVTAEKQDVLRAKRGILNKAYRGALRRVTAVEQAIADENTNLRTLETRVQSEEREQERASILRRLSELNTWLEEQRRALVEAEAELKRIRDTLKETIVTYCSDEDLKRWFFEGQLRLKQMVEEAVPNAKVIATGDCWVEVGKKFIRIIQDNSDLPSDAFLDKLAQKIQKELKNGKKQPDLILVAGLNLAPTDFSVKYPKAEGVHREITEVAVVQLPTCLDNDYIERITARGVKIGTEITKLVNDEDFTSGVVDYCWPCEFPQLRFWSSADLVDEKLFSHGEEIEKLILGAYQIYGEHEGDMQEGAHHQAYYTMPEFPYFKPLYQVHHDFFVGIGAPIHYYNNLGDIVQGENHEYHLEIPEEFRITHALERELGRLMRDTSLTAEQKAGMAAKLALRNSILGGTPRIDDQLENYEERAIKAGTDYFCMVLKNARRIRLEFIEKSSVITVIGGNHFGNTGIKNSGGVGKHFEEADIARNALVKALRRCSGFSDEDLERLVVAPKISGVSAALGAFGVLPENIDRDDIQKLSKQELKRLFPYCLSAKHKPSGKDGYGNKGLPVKSLRRARSTRGPTDPLYEGRFALEVAGHIDRDTSFISKGSLYSVSPAQEFRSPFAESLDLSLGDIGTKVIGVPKDRRGPIVITRFTYEVFFRYLKNPWPINISQLFPNAL